MPRLTFLLAVSILLVHGLAPVALHAGAWSQAKGRYYTKLSGIFYSADEAFDTQGNKGHLNNLNETFDSNQSFFYMEYGLVDRLTILGQANIGELISENDQVRQSTTGIGDVDIGAKYQLTDGPLVLAPYASLKLPTGYDTNNNPALGTGKADLALRLLAATSLHPVPVYLGAELGYRLRGSPFSNQIPYLFEVGVTPHQKLFTKVYLSGTNTLISDGGNTDAMDSMSMQVSEGDFTKVGFNAAVNAYGPVWVDFLYETIFTGKNTGAGTSLGIGLSLSR